jgi:uncharacterized protein YijF (DUF1287 family)
MLKKFTVLMPIVLISAGITGCSGTKPQQASNSAASKQIAKVPTVADNDVEVEPVVYEKRSPKRNIRKAINPPRYNNNVSAFSRKLSNAALQRLQSRVRYDGKYVKIAYPWGDVPANIGVCTDVVIRSYRKLGIDLQKEVHKDMTTAFNSYPNPRKWGLSRPDTNIDHRRVYNLRKFFQRKGAALPITRNARDYKPGDLVTWMVGPDLPHIGVVVDRPSRADPNRMMIVHNIAQGPQMEDILFRFPITGHYRYTSAHVGNSTQTYYASNQAQPRRNEMSHAQLVQAANLLGAGTQSRTAQAAPLTVAAAPSALSNAELMNNVVRLNNTAGPVVTAKNNSVKLATLTNDEINALLIK